MKNKFKLIGIIAMTAVIGFSTVGWSEYTVVPSKDYVVVGTIVLWRNI